MDNKLLLRSIMNYYIHSTSSLPCNHTCRFSTWPLQWRDNECDGVSNHQSLDCLLSCFMRRSEKASKLRVWPLWGESTRCPLQRASNAVKVSIWWHHNAYVIHSLDIRRRLVNIMINLLWYKYNTIPITHYFQYKIFLQMTLKILFMWKLYFVSHFAEIWSN